MFCPAFCHVDIDVCIYSTCAFLIVKWMLMLIMYSAVSAIFYFLYFYGGGGGEGHSTISLLLSHQQLLRWPSLCIYGYAC